MSKAGATALALGGAVVTLVVMAWFDTTVVREAARQGAQSFDSSRYALLVALMAVGSAGAVLLLAVLAWRSRSALVGVLYIAVGTYFAFQMWIWMNLASGQRNGSSPLLPYPLDRVVNHVFDATVGSLDAVGIVGAGMLVAGVAVMTALWRERPGARVPR